MQSFVNVRSISRICAIVVLLILVVAVPASAITPPTIDSVTPSTTSIVNGGNVVISFDGTCGSEITQASFGMLSPQGVSYGTSIQTTTNGNRWTGQASYTFAPDAPSGQYKIGRINVQDAAQNYVSKDFIPEVIINVQNSVLAQPPTIDSVTPSTISVVNGGNVIITFAGTCGSKITQASFGMQSPQGVSYGTSIQTTTNGNRWTGQASYTFASDAPSGQYKIGRINIEDAAQNYVSKDFIPEVIINVQNSGQSTPTSTATQTASPTTIPLTSKTTSITTIPTILPTTIVATTVVQTTVHTTVTSPPTLIPTTGQTTVITTVPISLQTTRLTTAPTPTITTSPTSSVEKLLEEQNKKIEEQNRLMAEQNKKMSEQNDLLTQILNYFKGIFGWK